MGYSLKGPEKILRERKKILTSRFSQKDFPHFFVVVCSNPDRSGLVWSETCLFMSVQPTNQPHVYRANQIVDRMGGQVKSVVWEQTVFLKRLNLHSASINPVIKSCANTFVTTDLFPLELNIKV